MPETHDTHEEAALSPRKFRRRAWASAAGAIVMAASALILTSATAARGADPAEVCNTSPGRPSAEGTYGPVNSVAIPGGGGTVHLYYNNTTGHNCAVTTNNGVGATYMDVGLRQAGNNGTAKWDSSPSYSQYAGPVYVFAKNICVDTTGAVGDQSAILTGTNCGG
jgi:hypothetical protein